MVVFSITTVPPATEGKPAADSGARDSGVAGDEAEPTADSGAETPVSPAIALRTWPSVPLGPAPALAWPVPGVAPASVSVIVPLGRRIASEFGLELAASMAEAMKYGRRRPSPS